MHQSPRSNWNAPSQQSKDVTKQESTIDNSDVPIESSASNLYRAPTWAKNINFDSHYTLEPIQSSTPINSGTRNSSFASPINMVGVALGGDSDATGFSASIDSRRPSAATSAARNSSGVEHSSYASLHSRQASSGQLNNFGSPNERNGGNKMNSNRSSILPSNVLAPHQRMTSSSSLSAIVSSDSLRPSMPTQLHSSADLYATNNPAQPESRSSTSMSMVSGSGGDHSDTAQARDMKRASVLSFQTALSGMGGYTSNEEANAFTDLEQLDGAMPRRPWLQSVEGYSRSGTSSYSSSPDDRLPGGWRGRNWGNEGDALRGTSPMPANTGSNLVGRRTPSQSPRLLLSPLIDDTSRRRFSASLNPVRSPTMSSKELPIPSQASSPRLKNVSATQSPRNSTLLSPGLHSSDLLSPVSGTSTIEGGGQGQQINSPAALSSETINQRFLARSLSSDLLDNDVTPMHQQSRISDSEKNNNTLSSRAENVTNPIDAPTLPEKLSPPVPSKDREVALSSPPLSEDIIPTTMSVDNVQSPKVTALATNIDSTSPISDYRTKPLGRLEESRETTEVEKDDVNSKLQNSSQNIQSADVQIGAGVGAHNAARTKARSNSNPASAVLMRIDGANGGKVIAPRAALAEGPSVPTMEPRAPSPASIETPPREQSPPPEGEVEARAEWEKAQMRRFAEQSKERSSRKDTFRGQLKPLQLVAAEEAKQKKDGGSRSTRPEKGSKVTTNNTFQKEHTRDNSNITDRVQPSNPSKSSTSNIVASKTNETLSTQQLQKMSARDSRLSTSMINLVNGMNEVGGAYPVFASPTLAATSSANASGIRQYPGLMPQRSLVPPFELQNRPDGLPSALTGPDGVRRNPNDPDVCLECMMRDEDMIDVHVLGAGLWERESDRDFDEACRLETEEDVRRAPSITSHGGTTENYGSNMPSGPLSDGSSNGKLRLTKIRVKRVAKGDPLTAERLKLHTQMNPPASSHRWRTLQTFLAVQAKYIAMDQRARGIQPTPLPALKQPDYDNLMIRTSSKDSKQNLPSNLIKIDERGPLTEQERLQKENDIHLAREARRRNAASASETRIGLPQAPHSVSALRSQTPTAGMESPTAEDETGKRFSAHLMGGNENVSNHSIPRRNNLPSAPAFGRIGSAQDLRSVPHAMLKSPIPDIPPSPSSSLAPPSAPFRSSTPQAFGSRGMRTTSSQLSLANSGVSMIDMHVGIEDRKDHRLSQTGFLPGTPLHATSPSAFNRAYYGFPGDGDEGEQGSLRYADASLQSNEVESSLDMTDKKRKKGGLRGLLSKISGKESSATEANQTSAKNNDADDSLGNRNRKSSFGGDAMMGEMQPPMGVGGLMNKARRSTSSLLNLNGRSSMDGTTILNDRLGLPIMNPPAMNSQSSFDMGPFGSGPLPPPRRESRDPRKQNAEGGDRRSRTLSAGNLFGKKKGTTNVGDIPVSSMDEQAQGRLNEYENEMNIGTNRNSQDLSRLSGNGLSIGANPASYRKSNLSESVGRPSPVLSNISQFDNQRLSNLASIGQKHDSTTMYQTSQSSDPVTQDVSSINTRPTTTESTNVTHALAPKRPPRNPSRGTSSQPASENMMESNNNLPSSMYSQTRSPLADQSQFQQFTPSQQQQYLMNGPQSGFNDQVHSFPSYEGGTDPMHTRSSSAGGSMNLMNPEMAMQEGEMNSRVRDRSASNGAPITQSRKNRLLKLPFTRNKRESVANSIASNKGPGTNGSPSLKSRSSRGTLDEVNMASVSSPVVNNGYHYSANNYGRPISSIEPPAFTYSDRKDSSLRTFDVAEENLSSPISQNSLGTGLKPWLRARRSSSNFDDSRSGKSSEIPFRSQSALGMNGPEDDFDSQIRSPSRLNNGSNSTSTGKKGFLPRLRTSSRAALRVVDED